MIHMRKKFDLSKCPFCINPVVKRISNFLDSNLFICFRVVRRAVEKKKKKTVVILIEKLKAIGKNLTQNICS